MRQSRKIEQNNKQLSSPASKSVLKIGATNDPLEQQADTIADQVMHMPENRLIQRKCSACEDEDAIHRKPLASFIQKKSLNQGNLAPISVSNQIDSSEGKGSPLPSSTKSFMESRFGSDFSNVNIHTEVEAVQMSQDLGAKAFTVGNDIFFNSSQYSPSTNEGRHLLAHELTHTIQQKGAEQLVQRQSIYEEVPNVTSRADGIVTGTVDRYEFDNQTDFNNRLANNRRSNTHHSQVGVRFDSNSCTLEVPIDIQIVNQAAGINTTCGDISGQNNDRRIRPVSQNAFDRAVQNIPALTRAELNNWYSIHLGNPEAVGCENESIPINVIVNPVTSNSDFTIVLTRNSGRSYVTGNGQKMVLCGGDVQNNATIIHEMGHAVLGHGDEYHERQGTRPESRERLGQYSRLAQDAPGRLQEFYERHFQFASAFMNTAFPGCNATLNRERSSNTEFTPTLNLGGIGNDRGMGFYFGLGLQMGIPLTEMRRLNLALGLNSNLLLGAEGSFSDVLALLVGFRAGLNYRNSFGNSSTTFNLSGFGEVGGAYNFGADTGRVLPPEQFAAYAEGGANIGLNLVSNTLNLGLEGAAGVLDLGRGNNSYYRLGITYGINF